MKIGFIGAGTVGTALGLSLAKSGYSVVAVVSRSRSSAEKLSQRIEGSRAFGSLQEAVDESDLIFVTTPDDAIAPVVAGLSWKEGKAVLHCSGAASTDILEPARQAGATVGAFHPLQSFANVEQAIENLPGSTFAIEATEPLLGDLKEMATRLNGTPVELGPGDKVLYHAAAVFASNYTVAIMKLATDLWQQFDVPTAVATKALMPLLQGTVNNINNIGLPNCLTGPIARGDIGTIEKHLVALQERAPGHVAPYRELGLQTITVALGKGKIDEERAEEMRTLLKRF